MNTSLTSAKL